MWKPYLGHLEGWGALLALQLRGWAPSSWPRPPSTPGAQVSPHHHLIHFLLILVPQGEVLFLHFCTTFEEPHNDLGFICVTGHLTIQFNRIFPSCYIGRRALQIFWKVKRTSWSPLQKPWNIHRSQCQGVAWSTSLNFNFTIGHFSKNPVRITALPFLFLI